MAACHTHVCLIVFLCGLNHFNRQHHFTIFTITFHVSRAFSSMLYSIAAKMALFRVRYHFVTSPLLEHFFEIYNNILRAPTCRHTCIYGAFGGAQVFILTMPHNCWTEIVYCKHSFSTIFESLALLSTIYHYHYI